jgi:hypothetical protein
MNDRYSIVGRWEDVWYTELSPHSKLLFDYLCDKCDDSGFLEVHYQLIELQTKLNREEIKKSLIELKKQLITDKKQKLWVKGHLFWQRKLPLIEGNSDSDWIITKLKFNLPKFNDAPEIKKILECVVKTEIKKKQKSDKNTKEITDFELTLVDENFRGCFERWLNHKKKRGETYKSSDSIESCYKKLLKYSDNNPSIAEEIINDSISNNYAGFFKQKINMEQPHHKKEQTGKAEIALKVSNEFIVKEDEPTNN